MHELNIDATQPKPALYASVIAQTRALLEGERDAIANLANTSALLYHSLPDLNWVGFYLLKDGELVVGPFQGKPACVRIALDKAVFAADKGKLTGAAAGRALAKTGKEDEPCPPNPPPSRRPPEPPCRPSAGTPPRAS